MRFDHRCGLLPRWAGDPAGGVPAPPRYLILDFRLPGKDGWAVLQELAQASCPVRVVLLTAALDVDEALKACRLGVNGVVLKEMTDHLLVPCIREVHAGERWVEKTLH